MLNAFSRILLTSTALAPVGFTYAWVAWTQGMNQSAVLIAGSSAILVLLCVILLYLCKKSLPVSDFQPATIEPADHENTAFLLLYVMPLFTSQFDTLEWKFWIPTVVIFGLITATGYSYHFNPLLGLMGWHFYKTQSPEGVTFVIITKKHLRSPSSKIRVGQLTEYILIDMEK
ncbi:hypothetical protein [Brevundimonas naejangsanensis]|uniref:hypothetical protein n=1 Tax=Brevundimonas naejangsanensis TaxID=588932 RepID=UPI0026F12751|nr:hypothetical protein [Brevundimonas naejangsanensis]